MIGPVLLLAEAEKIGKGVDGGGILQREVFNLRQLAFFIDEALGAIGVDHPVAPAGGTAGLDDNADIVRPFFGSHLGNIGGSAALPIRNNHILRDNRGGSHRLIRVIEISRELQTAHRQLTVELGEAVFLVLFCPV